MLKGGNTAAAIGSNSMISQSSNSSRGGGPTRPAPLPFGNSPHHQSNHHHHHNRSPHLFQNSIRLNSDEFTRNNSTIDINGKVSGTSCEKALDETDLRRWFVQKYEHIKESDFTKVSELGAGSFGQVERMLHRPSNTELAVKVRAA